MSTQQSKKTSLSANVLKLGIICDAHNIYYTGVHDINSIVSFIHVFLCLSVG